MQVTSSGPIIFGWGLDGYGNRHLCRDNDNKVLFCVPQGWCLVSAIETLQGKYS